MTIIYEVPEDVVPLIQYIPTDLLCSLLSELIKERAYAPTHKEDVVIPPQEDMYRNMLEEIKGLIASSSMQVVPMEMPLPTPQEPVKEMPKITFTDVADSEEDLDEESIEARNSFLNAILK